MAKSNSASKLDAKFAVYCFLKFNGEIYLELKQDVHQLPGKKIRGSDDPAKQIIEALNIKYGLDIKETDLKTVSSKTYPDTSKDSPLQQKCFVYSVELKEKFKMNELNQNLFLFGFSQKKLSGVSPGRPITEITQRIIDNNLHFVNN